ncbi:pre-mRNA-splicing factor 38B-like [Pecten maximus]|uniref:pre-mRNA-splicing factor 38B-like n=1 Tax=Pecten maximus TaxID=6579 RepID=UPI0014583455|nr:pre-mRNA-splicing factor 38B-like [Pecten maximus]
MGFLGRGRGSTHAVKREGGIHASSRKSNSGDHSGSKRDQHGRSGRSNSRERSSHSRDRRRSRDRSRSPLRTQYSKDIPATESLRITVGNDIYKEKSRSPLSGRLGPPVDRSPYDESPSDRRKSNSDNFNRFDNYDQEAKYYDQGNRRRDYDQVMGRSGGYDSNRQRSREYSSDRYDERNKDFNRETRGRIDKYSGDDRYKDDMDRRRGSSIDRRDNNRAPKPLKSILKKKGPAEETLPGLVTNPVSREEKNLFPIMRPADINQDIDSRTQQSTENTTRGPPFDNHQSRSEGRGNSRSGLPGMSSYMDIEDEEKFLYGDDDHDLEKGNSNNKPGSRPSIESKSRSEDAFYSGSKKSFRFSLYGSSNS